ncbi:hypothetical protein GCM10023148_31320 [Actinokineospora soli]
MQDDDDGSPAALHWGFPCSGGVRAGVRRHAKNGAPALSMRHNRPRRTDARNGPNGRTRLGFAARIPVSVE